MPYDATLEHIQKSNGYHVHYFTHPLQFHLLTAQSSNMRQLILERGNVCGVEAVPNPSASAPVPEEIILAPERYKWQRDEKALIEIMSGFQFVVRHNRLKGNDWKKISEAMPCPQGQFWKPGPIKAAGTGLIKNRKMF